MLCGDFLQLPPVLNHTRFVVTDEEEDKDKEEEEEDEEGNDDGAVPDGIVPCGELQQVLQECLSNLRIVRDRCLQFAFQAPVWSEMTEGSSGTRALECRELRKVWRQSDREFVAILQEASLISQCRRLAVAISSHCVAGTGAVRSTVLRECTHFVTGRRPPSRPNLVSSGCCSRGCSQGMANPPQDCMPPTGR